jgi:hypothetical protein
MRTRAIARLTGTLLATGLLMPLPALAAIPTSDRGPGLSATEESQQTFLRRLRQEVAVQDVLNRHLLTEPDRFDPLLTAPPALHRALLQRLEGQEGISRTTLQALRAFPAAVRPVGSHSVVGTRTDSTCSSFVDTCFAELQRLVDSRYGTEPAPDATAVAEVPAVVESELAGI